MCLICGSRSVPAGSDDCGRSPGLVAPRVRPRYLSSRCSSRSGRRRPDHRALRTAGFRLSGPPPLGDGLGFLSLHERILAQEGFAAASPRALLAAVIVLDQFSRNLFRGTPRAFAADPIARQLSRTAVGQGFDLAVKERERLFLYLPFEHSEDRDDQALSVELIGRLGNAEWTDYAIAHKAIIDQFGRFPHRNAILNRQSSASEIALLEDPKDWF